MLIVVGAPVTTGSLVNRRSSALTRLPARVRAASFMNNIAQVVECVFAVERSIEIIDELLNEELKIEKNEIKPKAGRGVGSVEVPRGILFHEYEYDENGICTEANCVIPTNLNHNNIQKDFEKYVKENLSMDEKEMGFNLEMLVRAYDPCISCSTHFLNIEFK